MMFKGLWSWFLSPKAHSCYHRRRERETLTKSSCIYRKMSSFLTIGIGSFLLRWTIRWSWNPGSLWIGCAWSHSRWFGCRFCTEWQPQKRPNTKPSVTSAKSVPSLASGSVRLLAYNQGCIQNVWDTKQGHRAVVCNKTQNCTMLQRAVLFTPGRV